MPIAFTSGEPSGIGPDIAIIHAQKERKENLLVYCDPDVLINRAKQLNLPITLKENETSKATELSIFPVETDVGVEPGVLNPKNANYVLEIIRKATHDCLEGQCSGILTGPINKAVINQSGIEFSGHTEYLADLTNTPKTVMLLATNQLRVALATTHLALNDVSKNISQESLTKIITIINNDFKYFGIKKPRILVCGLNPHAGENGYLGDEEITTIIPVINKLKKAGFNLTGPVPADTAFTPQSRMKFDAVICMYHDQGHIPIKMIAFDRAVNVTLGLSAIRTSVDHGTAFDIAWTGKADPGSLFQAVRLAANLSKTVK